MNSHPLHAEESTARLEFEEGDSDAAMRRVHAILDQMPQSPISSLGFKICRERGDMQEALTISSKIREAGRFTWAHCAELATVADAVGDSALAVELVQEALQFPTVNLRAMRDQLVRTSIDVESLVPGDGVAKEGDTVTPDPDRLSSSLRLFGAGRIEEAIELVREAISAGVQVRRIHQLMRDPGLRPQPEAVERILELVLAAGLGRREFAYEATLNAWGRAREPERATAIFERAAHDGCASIQVHRALVAALTRSGRHDEGAEALIRMIEEHRTLEVPGLPPLENVLGGANELTCSSVLETVIEHGVQLSASQSRYFERHPLSRIRDRAGSLPAGADLRVARSLEDLIDESQFEEAQSVLLSDGWGSSLSHLEALALDHRIVTTFGRSGRPDAALDHVVRMRDVGRLPDGHIYFAAMMAAATASDVVSTERMFGDLLADGEAVSGWHLGALIFAHSAAGDPQQAETYLAWVHSLGLLGDPRYHYGPIIAAYRRLHRPEDVARIIAGMETLDVAPDAHSVGESMRAWADAGRPEMALKLLERFRQQGGTPDDFHYAIAIESHRHDVALAESLWAEMLEVGLQPSQVHYTWMMHANSTAGDYERVHELAGELEDDGPGHDSYSLSALIEAVGRAGDMNALDELESTLLESPDLADHFTVGALIRSWLVSGQTSRATTSVTRLIELHPDLVTTEMLDSVAYAIGTSGDETSLSRFLERAASLGYERTPLTDLLIASRLDDHEQARKSLAAVATWTPKKLALAIGALASTGLADEAINCLRKLAQTGQVRPKNIGQILNALTRSSRPDDAESLLFEFLPRLEALPDEETFLFNLVLRAHAWADDVSAAETIKEEMLRRGLSLDRYSIGALQMAHRADGSLYHQDQALRDQDSEWHGMQVVLGDVVHEFSQWIGQLGQLAKAARRLAADSDNEPLVEMLKQIGGVGSEISERLSEYQGAATAGMTGRSDVREVLDWVTSRLAPEAQRNGVVVLQDFGHPRESHAVAVNEFYLRLVVRALLGNAIDALSTHDLPPGQRRIWASAIPTRRNGGDWVDIYVRDNGPGIPEGARERIFERGFTLKRQRGLGLGLSLVSTVVASAGGAVALTRSDDSGTEFWIRLPGAPDE